ncbi:MAG: hypothetical protein AAF974_05735 [Cyanobacteria bacterium P01_E01_bin.34]
MDGAERKLGFYQDFYVEASDLDSAELSAVELIRASDLQKVVLNTEDDPPMLCLDQISEVYIPNETKFELGGQGRIFFSMEDS